jgi:hypothetical protein
VRRAVEAGARAVSLTGSTARDRRTETSDLDHHVVGTRFKTSDLPGDVDLYVRDADRFWAKLRAGDDFVQWTLRFGCILLDDGIFRAGLRVIANEQIWPDPRVKIRRLPEMRRLAERLIAHRARRGPRSPIQVDVRVGELGPDAREAGR